MSAAGFGAVPGLAVPGRITPGDPVAGQGAAAAVSLTAAGQLAAAARATTAGAAVLTASPALTVTGHVLVPGPASLHAAAALTAGPLALNLPVALSAVPALTAGGRVTVPARTGLSATGILWLVSPVPVQHFSAWRPLSPVPLVGVAPRRRFYAQALDGTWLHRDLPVTGGSLTWGLSGGDACAPQIAPPDRALYDSSGNLLLPAWGCLLYAEEEDQVIWGGILNDPEYTSPTLTLNGIGFPDYAQGFIYNGAPYVKTNVDPLDVIRDLWDYIQTRGTSDPSLPGAVTSNLGLVVDTTPSPTRIGNVKDSTGQVLDVPALSKTPGVALEQFTPNGGDNQLWSFSALDGQGYVTIKNKNSGLLVGVSEGSTAAGAPVIQFTADGSDSQKWQVVNNGDWVTFVNKHSGMVMNVKGAAGQARAPVIQWPSVNADNEHWIISTPDTDGYSTIASVNTGAVTPYELDWWNASDLGQEISNVAQQAPCDFAAVHAWTGPGKQAVSHRLALGYPRLGTRRANLRFAEGENVTALVTVTNRGSSYANEVIGLGAGTGSQMLRSVAANSDGRLLRRLAYTDQSLTTSQAVMAAARKTLFASQGLDEVTSLTVIDHPHARLGSFGPGDDIPVTLAGPVGERVIWHRITSYTVDLATNVVTLTTARSDTFTYMPSNASGSAGGGSTYVPGIT